MLDRMRKEATRLDRCECVLRLEEVVEIIEDMPTESLNPQEYEETIALLSDVKELADEIEE